MTAVHPRPPSSIDDAAVCQEPCVDRRSSSLEPGLGSMIVAALVLLVAVGVVLWVASSTPNGRSVIVTIRTP